MRLLFVCIVFVGAVATDDRAVVRLRDGTTLDLGRLDDDVGVRRHCAVRRVDLAQRTLDALGREDSCLAIDDLKNAFDTCLTWYERAGLKFGRLFGAVYTPETIMARCDADSNGRLCGDDFVATAKRCNDPSATNTCMCDCESMAALDHYVLSREPCE